MVNQVYTFIKMGSRYVGTFKDGLPEGNGVCTYISGNRYEGEWSGNAPHGEGTMYYTNGRVYRALWRHGKPIKVFVADEKYTSLDHIDVDVDQEVKIWAVIVGVSRYTHMPVLNYSDDDAYRIYAFLKSPEGGALKDDQIRILIDEEATRDGILEAMQHTFYRADENDVVMLYFSGHGLKGTFLPIDYDGFENTIRHDEIREILSQSKAKNKVCFADACHSGSMSGTKSGYQLKLDEFYDRLGRSDQSLAFMLSSKSEEYSLEDGGLRQGIFSHYLLRGMKGEADMDGDQQVTIRELFDFVHYQVRKYTGNLQTPVLTGTFDQNMPIAMIR